MGPLAIHESVPPVTRTTDDPRTTWLLQADDDALAITPRATAPALWRRITRRGRPIDESAPSVTMRCSATECSRSSDALRRPRRRSGAR